MGLTTAKRDALLDRPVENYRFLLDTQCDLAIHRYWLKRWREHVEEGQGGRIGEIDKEQYAYSKEGVRWYRGFRRGIWQRLNRTESEAPHV